MPTKSKYSTHLYSPLTSDITAAAAFITSGRIVAFPSGTSYGLAADATQGYALQRLRLLKGRPEDKSFTVMLNPALWGQYLQLTATETAFLTRAANQALTLLVKPQPSLEHLAKADLVGLRVIDHPLMNQLCQAMPVPLTATSANRTDEPACFSPECVQAAFPGLLPDDQLGEDDPHGASGTTYNLSLAAIIDGGTLPPHKPTTIVRLQKNGSLTVVRPGAVTPAMLDKLIA
ncbi:MAG TPA: hypothetical protein DDW41_06815 [Candidatus Andersenbacteria bacterium]|nr:MAG: Sua5/YciO/YrdC/YwlC family protein [Parcubacteria group bacterium GW2011_GWA2_45_14]OGY34761.1 MAG: hypothetical protein A3B76_00125 [Candidatus Andersenbacteria bacterium RIFCSPHIGHO2_02_FULL_46_16]OGY38115.1 MAG: hypothetical protein A3I08_03915 [Candidatus Andersenbacteria bacterium RIFCSPLOWO2_02_FULL_46_11]HBE90886.1 hypothetical protein [Candidatus Andersenbacteria bacterium]